MKKFLPLFIVLVSFTQVYAQSGMLITENFTGYPTGNLNSGSSGWTAASSYSSDYVQVANSSPLFYPGYTSGSQYVNLTAADDYSNWSYPYWHFPDDPTKKFLGNTTVSLSSATTFYISFVVRVASSSNISSTGSATQTMALQTSNGDHLADFFIGKNNSGNMKFGIDKSDGTTSNYTSGTYAYGTTHLIIIRYDIATGNNNDKLYMWVDPASLATEPSTGSAVASVTSSNDGYSTSGGNAVSELQLFQDDNSASASFDAFKIAYSKVNSATAWATLNPVGAPLPVKFGDLKAYSKDKGVQVEWEVYSELNVDHYEIERSADGVNFYSIGKVTAKSLDGKLLYSFYDAAPAAGNNYYRIANEDIDGKSSYSSIVRVSLSSSASAGVLVYPNPVTDKHFSVQLTNLEKGDYTIEIFNSGGQEVYAKQFTHSGGTINQSISLPSTLQRGIYNIRVAGNGFKQAKSILVQ
ncbi:MAG: T9SS type A sorting domain-containing protein [Chitinophagaceae bacterium]